MRLHGFAKYPFRPAIAELPLRTERHEQLHQSVIEKGQPDFPRPRHRIAIFVMHQSGDRQPGEIDSLPVGQGPIAESGRYDKVVSLKPRSADVDLRRSRESGEIAFGLTHLELREYCSVSQKAR